MSPGDHAGVVYDGFYPGNVDIDFTDEVTAISAYFDGFLGQQCGGIAQYQWAIGSDDEQNRGSVMSYTDDGIVVVGNGSGYAQVSLKCDYFDQEISTTCTLYIHTPCLVFTRQQVVYQWLIKLSPFRAISELFTSHEIVQWDVLSC